MGFPDKERGVLSALLIGSKADMDYDTRLEFSGAGIIHVISISGMHVGIIYLLLMFLLSPIKGPGLKFFKLSVVLFCLWFYASLTGMSPSVFRASVMFSVFAISKYSNLHYNIYHSLAISAFVILLFTPEAILNLGFWLSFFAVASIVYFYPKINGVWYFKTPWMRLVWNLCSLSLAAQIGTAPLSIYAFGYFPVWFLISNVIIVPVVPFVFVGGFVLMVFDRGSVINELIIGGVEDVMGFMLQFSHWINELPFSKFSGIQIGEVEMFGIYAGMSALVIFQQNKRIFFLKMTLVAFVFVVGTNIMASISRMSKDLIVVHDVKGHTAVSCLSSQMADSLISDSIDSKTMSQSVLPLWNYHLRSETKRMDIEDSSICFVANGYQCGIVINGLLDVAVLECVKEEIDFIVLTQRVPQKVVFDILEFCGDKKVVFDSSVPKYKARALLRRFKSTYKNLYFVSLGGAVSL